MVDSWLFMARNPSFMPKKGHKKKTRKRMTDDEHDPHASDMPSLLDGGTVKLLTRLFRETSSGRTFDYIFVIMALVCMAAATAGLAWLMRYIINDVFVKRDINAMWGIVSTILLLSLIKGSGEYFSTVVIARIENGITASLQRRLFDKVLAMRMEFFTKTHSSRLIARMSNNVRAASAALHLVISALGRDLLTLAALVGVMVMQDPLLSVAACAIGPFALLGIRWIGRRMRGLGDEEFQGMADVISIVQDTAIGIQTVKSFTLEPTMRDRLDRAVSGVEKRTNAIVRIGALTSPMMETLGGVVIASMLVYAGWQTVSQGKTPGEFMAFVTAFLMAYEPAKRLAKTQVTLQRSLFRVRKLYDLLDYSEQEEMGDKPPLTQPMTGHIVASQLRFGYGKRAVLDDISLEIKPGEIVALVGSSGAGKSTLLSLLLRFYEPWSGSIKIDGIEIKELQLRDLRRLIAVVSQQTMLFSGSIGDNIRMGRPDATQEEIEAAAAAAAVTGFIADLPKGFDTLVGERHATLSGGQAQRLAIARAILKSAPILLLDEATSALDGETEREVRNALEGLMKGRATLVIAHRPSTIERADRIYLLDQGRVVATGQHKDLLTTSPLYRRLFGEISKQDEDCHAKPALSI
jgi:ATP-binding cassette subfamily B protein